MEYGVYGKFVIPRENGVVVPNAELKRAFWADVENAADGLSSACGCFVFVAQGKPWYVGLAEKQPFSTECFQPHKIDHYTVALSNYKRAEPSLYLFARQTSAGNFSDPSSTGHRDAAFLENVLIGLAISRNPDLRNVKGTKLLKDMNVPGLLNTQAGQGRAHAAQEIRKVFGV